LTDAEAYVRNMCISANVFYEMCVLQTFNK